MNDAILLQQVYSGSEYGNMLRLSFPRHMDYCLRHKFDYQCIMGDIIKDHPTCQYLGRTAPLGAWAKIYLIRDALAIGYEYVCWLDADALIYDLTADLRDAFKEFEHIGACQHPGPPVHLNVGVAFYRNTEPARKFIESWLDAYGKPTDGWIEQGIFNKLSEQTGIVKRMDDKWNATHNAQTDVKAPVILGYHGPAQFTPMMRFQAMLADIARTT
jgi:hypothetical protein